MGSAEKLLEKLRRSPNDYGQVELFRLYKGYGFEDKGGTKHAVMQHRTYGVRVTFPRHESLPPAYAREAVKVIDQVIQMRDAEAREEAERVNG